MPMQTFDHQALDTLERLQTACVATLEAIPNPITRATDLARELQIENKLGWQIYRVVQATNPLAAAAHVPSTTSLRAVLKTLERRNFPDSVTKKFARATDDFDELVTTHAGSRDVFNTMISSLVATKNTDSINLQHRRAAFRANRHIWGVQAKTQIKMFFLHPSDDQENVDLATVGGHVDLLRLRHDAPLIISSSRLASDDNADIQTSRLPLDPRGVNELGIGLLPDFCSEPNLQFKAMQRESGSVIAELVSRDVGNTGAVTYLAGWIARQVAPRWRCENNEKIIFNSMLRIPCEWQILGLLLHRDIGDHESICNAIYSGYQDELPFPSDLRRLEDLFPAHELKMHTCRGSLVASSPQVPRLAEIVQNVFDRLGWDADTFSEYRTCISYPVVPSTLQTQFQLEDGSWVS